MCSHRLFVSHHFAIGINLLNAVDKMQYKMILATYRHILREHVICVQYDGAKISYRIEFERHFNRFTGHTH